MKKFLLIEIILLILVSGMMVDLIECSASVSIHSGTISGVIKIDLSGKAFIPGSARIDLLDAGIFTVSSFSDGHYTLKNVPAGKHSITVFKHGYTSARKIINVVEGQTVTGIDFNLKVKEPAEKLGFITYLCFNLDYQPLNNLKVRQALNYAIDKQTLVDKLNSTLNLKRVVAQSPLPPNMIGYNPNITGYPYNVNTAKQLLSQEGYPEGFSIDLYYNNENLASKLIAKEVKTYLAPIGIKVDLEGKKWDQLLKLVAQGKSPFFIMSWGADTPDPADYLNSLYHSKGSSNFSHYNNSMIDNQIKQAWETIDDVSFVQLIQQIEKNIVDDALAIYLYH